MAKMQEVYGFSVDPDQIAGPYVDFTVDHLFGEVWTRSALDIRDRRLMTIGVLAALGQPQLVEIQFRSALERGELTEEQVRETRAPPDPLHRVAAVHRHQRGGRAGHRPAPPGRLPREPGSWTDRPWSASTSPARWPSSPAPAGGIGQAYAEALAAAGAAVMVADIAEDNAAAVAAAIVASGGTALSRSRVDVADPDSARGHGRPDRRAVRRASTTWSTTPPSSGACSSTCCSPWTGSTSTGSCRSTCSGALNCVRACYPAMKAARRRGHRQPVLHRRLPVRRLLRTGQGRGQLDHPAAGPRARGPATSGPTPSPPGPSTPRRPAPWSPTPS